MKTLTKTGRFLPSILVASLLGVGCAADPAPDSETAEVSDGASADSSTNPNENPELMEVPEGIVNFTRVDATVACAGATPPEALAKLAEQGYQSVINFRTAEEDGAQIDESRAAAENAGMRYVHLPFRSPTPEIVASFLEVIADPANQPAFIHCGSANRVGAMWLIKRVQLDGWTVDDALSEAEAIGLKSQGLKDFALSYVDAG